MNTELPSTTAIVHETSATPCVESEATGTLTVWPLPRGQRAAGAATQWRVGTPRDARLWPWHASVVSADRRVLTLTLWCGDVNH